MIADPEKHTTVFQLIEGMERFQRHNSHSNDPQTRWLSSFVDDLLVVARQVRSGGLSEKWKAEVAKFRQAEIAKEKEKLEREIAELDREHDKIVKRVLASQ